MPAHIDRTGNTFAISRMSGFVISLASIVVAAVVMFFIGFALLPSSIINDVIGVLVASFIIPVIALFKPLQEFTVFPDGIGFSTIFSKRVYTLLWDDVAEVRLRRDVSGVMNLEFQKRGSSIYKKVPLSVIPEYREFLHHLLESFPTQHPKRSLLEHVISSYLR